MKFDYPQLFDAARYLLSFVAVLVSSLYALSRLKSVREFVYKQQYVWWEKMIMIVFFGFMGMLASEYGYSMAGAVVNVRDAIAIFATILGGPAVGIGAAFISGVYRMTPMLVPWITGSNYSGWAGLLGYWSAAGCGIATTGAGFVGAYLFIYKKFRIRTITPRQILSTAVIVTLWQVIHLQLINPLVAPLYTDKTFMWVEYTFFTTLLFPQMFVSFMGTSLLLFMSRDLMTQRESETAMKEIREAEKQIEEMEKGK